MAYWRFSRVGAVLGGMAITLPWYTVSNRLFGVTTYATLTLLDVIVYALDPNYSGFMGFEKNMALLFFVGCFIAWFHDLGALGQTVGILGIGYYLYLNNQSLVSALGYGYYLGVAASLMGLYSLYKNRRKRYW